jgi:protein-S-isoprenylcysteine O-methyltransferase Ste14
MFLYVRLILFVLGTGFILIISWRALGNPKNHGFYRFFAFEACLVLLILNMPFWFQKPLSLLQILSWILLITSVFAVLLGFLKLSKYGKPKPREESRETYRFEETSVLITDGIYRYIRHPMYSSLIFFAWGAWFKHISVETTITASIASIAALFTAKIEDKENIKIFGSTYKTYIKKTRMFIPFIL